MQKRRTGAELSGDLSLHRSSSRSTTPEGHICNRLLFCVCLLPGFGGGWYGITFPLQSNWAAGVTEELFSASGVGMRVSSLSRIAERLWGERFTCWANRTRPHRTNRYGSQGRLYTWAELLGVPHGFNAPLVNSRRSERDKKKTKNKKSQLLTHLTCTDAAVSVYWLARLRKPFTHEMDYTSSAPFVKK